MCRQAATTGGGRHGQLMPSPSAFLCSAFPYAGIDISAALCLLGRHASPFGASVEEGSIPDHIAGAHSLHPVFLFGNQTLLDLTQFLHKNSITYMVSNYYIIELKVKMNLAISI